MAFDVNDSRSVAGNPLTDSNTFTSNVPPSNKGLLNNGSFSSGSSSVVNGALASGTNGIAREKLRLGSVRVSSNPKKVARCVEYALFAARLLNKTMGSAAAVRATVSNKMLAITSFRTFMEPFSSPRCHPASKGRLVPGLPAAPIPMGCRTAADLNRERERAAALFGRRRENALRINPPHVRGPQIR